MASSGLGLAFDVVLHPQLVAIEDGIGELRDPVAEDADAGGVGEHQVKLDVAMAEEEVVDVGVCAQVVLGKEHQMLLVLAQIARRVLSLVQFAAVSCPTQAHIEAPAWMHAGKEDLTDAIVEEETQKLELRVGVAQTVAMCQEENLVGKLQRDRFAVHDDATLSLQIVVCPHVVVAGEEVHLHAQVRQLAHLS